MKHSSLASAALILASPLFAQDESIVSLTIRFGNGTNWFQVGQIIPVELAFSASIPDAYDTEMRNYDRSGRLNIEAFHVTPPGAKLDFKINEQKRKSDYQPVETLGSYVRWSGAMIGIDVENNYH